MVRSSGVSFKRSSGVYLDGISNKLSLAENHIYGSSRLALQRPAKDIFWSYSYTSCGLGCRTILPPEAVPPPVPVISYKTERNLGFKEFELTNHLGNVIATVSDRKIQINTCSQFLRTFNDGNLAGILPDLANISIENNMLKVIPLSAYGGVNFTYPTEGGVEYNISFDMDMGNSDASDGLTATLYGYNQTTDEYGPVFTSIPINGNGTYNLSYTGQPATSGYTKLYFVFGTNTGGDAHYFYIDNFKVALPNQNIVLPNPNPPCPAANLVFDHYFPDLLLHTDYYAGGMQMPGRNYTSSSYRYGHNGQEKDDEIFVGAYTAEFWEYDSRILRRWNTDPIVKPWESPYACFRGNPIYFADPSGLDGEGPNGECSGDGKINDKGNTEIYGKNGITGKMEWTEYSNGGPDDSNSNLSSAPTGNGPNSGQPLPNSPKQSISPPQHLYNNTWLVTWGSNTLYSATNDNIMNWYHVSYLGEPNWWDRADWSKGDGGGTIGYGAGSIGTNGDWTAGYGKFSIGGDISGNPSSLVYNGGYGGSVSADGLRIGPLGATMENWAQDGGTAIVHDYYGGPATKTINATFIGTKISTSLSYSMGLRGVLSETLSNGFQRSSNLGSKSVIGANIGLKSGEFGAEISIPLKYK